jgi:hypothetical protein
MNDPEYPELVDPANLPNSAYPAVSGKTVSSICRDLARLIIPHRKYKTDQRRKQLIGCRQMVIIKDFFQTTFRTSIFTKLAMRCGFG